MKTKRRISLIILCTFALIAVTFLLSSCKGKIKTATLTSISVTYNQGDEIVYTSTSLDELRPSISVTLEYSDGTTATTSDYELSGELHEGTSVITVTYKEFKKTFTVDV